MLTNIMLAGAEAMGIPMTEKQAGQFAKYHDMLV